ncbi:anthranilate synthase component I [Vagococcus acidifermentans]|uniref:Anthranilate synthase component 1 n=1 Tax=Vagococcus acidifermentans TaxID=564710 RepID=A0A430AM95_9ENTE|nr:anthranilate synthase component I [Vagococcus acidifermentans]RSU09238.1 anthranilate synthase component I [Vagococcus acidifermentans]
MRIIKQMNGDCITPVSAFLRIRGKNKCLLESVPKEEASNSCSLIAFDPVAELRYHNGLFSVSYRQTGECRTYPCSDPLKEVETYVLKNSYPEEKILFQGGAIGYVGYDVAACYEEIGQVPHDELQIPDMIFFLYETYIVFDHKTNNLTIVSENTYSDRPDSELQHSADVIMEQLNSPETAESQTIEQEQLAFTSNFSQEEYENIVAQAKKLITAGDLFQVVPSQRLKARFTQNPFDYYRKLRSANPSTYLYYLDLAEGFQIIGSSPESLVRVSGYTVTTNPIAGTRKRGQTENEDAQLAAELLHDEKERAEHLMLIDLGRNDIAKIAESGSVTVPVYMTIEKFRYVMHIVSVVEGRRRTGVTAMDALKATLPAGTVSGAPKIRAMTRIYQWEPVKRGIYAGAVGYLSQNDQADFAIAIRTMVVKDRYAYVQAGGGVVYDSNPTAEYLETMQKARTLLEVDLHDFNN